MESSGTESVPQHQGFLLAADGGTCWHAHLVGHVFHTVFLHPLVGDRHAMRMVGILCMGVSKSVPHSMEVVDRAAHTSGTVVDF